MWYESTCCLGTELWLNLLHSTFTSIRRNQSQINPHFQKCFQKPTPSSESNVNLADKHLSNAITAKLSTGSTVCPRSAPEPIMFPLVILFPWWSVHESRVDPGRKLPSRASKPEEWKLNPIRSTYKKMSFVYAGEPHTTRVGITHFVGMETPLMKWERYSGGRKKIKNF